MTSPSPAEFLAAAPAPVGGSSAWASRYAAELRRVFLEHAAQAPRTLQQQLGPSELGVECLTGDTEVVTRQGIRRIGELNGDLAKLLVPMLYEGSEVRKKWGRFLEVPVECFGMREVYAVVLRRNQESKTVRATGGHRWFRTFYSGKNKTQEVLTTVELKPGHKLTQLRRAMPRHTTLMHWAVSQGFVFYSDIRGLPRHWKSLPPLDESTSFLMSWLAGYFAADGCVTEDGHCSISSARRDHLEFVRSLAAVCGVGYGQVQTHMRRGISGAGTAAEETPLYRLSLRRRDLPSWFFLLPRHAERAAYANQVSERDPHWIVESVAPTGKVEPVYCARVEGVGAFALADDLMTGNCDRQVAGKMAALPTTNHVVDPWPSIVGTACHAWAAEAFSADNIRRGVLRWVAENRVTPVGFEGHPGTADLYDAAERAVVDHKFLGESSMAKVRKDPPRKYVVQLLLYGLGYWALGLPVTRVALAAYPRTAASLDGLYVWDRAFTTETGELTSENVALLAEVAEQTPRRAAYAEAIVSGALRFHDVPHVPDADECFFCPFYRPQTARDGGPGCAGSVAA